MTTYRERREQRAEKLDEWATKREATSAALYDQAQTMAAGIPFGQPILVDHYSAGRARRYRARIVGTYERSFENADKARDMASRAAGITSQLAGAIYDDDPDALDALEARIAGLEVEREAIKAYNVSCRKGAPDVSVLSDHQRRHYAEYLVKGQPFPSYALQNLGGNITRNRQRLEQVQRRQARAERTADAGGVLVETRGAYAVVTFAEKPARDVIDALKAAGFRWAKGSWCGTAANLPASLLEGLEGVSSE